jgi:RING finger protein 113A
VDLETPVNSYTIEELVGTPKRPLTNHFLISFFILDLAGWQLDKLAENPKKQVGDDASDSDSDLDDEDVPFACLICRKPFTEPIVTRCGHYFDSACAIKRFAKTPKCLACGAPTGGIFNRADKILAKVEKRRQEKKASHGDDDDDDNVANDGDRHGGHGPQIEGLKGDSDGASSGDEDDTDED